MLIIECWLLDVEAVVFAGMSRKHSQTEGFNIQHSTLNHQHSTERPVAGRAEAGGEAGCHGYATGRGQRLSM
jgi:hypothetical protein